MTQDELQAALDDLVREGKVERLPNGRYRATEAGVADTLNQAAHDPAVRHALNDELSKLGLPPIIPGNEKPQ